MKFIKPSPIKGAVSAPASKSALQRALFAASLAEGESIIHNATMCADSLAALTVIEALGARIESYESGLSVRGGGVPAQAILDCGESGLCLRMAAALASRFDREITLSGKEGLLKRPIQMIEEPLAAFGVQCRTAGGNPPVTLRGPIKGGKARIDGSLTSQFLSGLLMVLPTCRAGSELEVENLKSAPYVSMTLEVMKEFGVSLIYDPGFERFRIEGGQKYIPCRYTVEGDWSGAACLLVAGALCGEVSVRNLRRCSLQADRRLLSVLRDCGANVAETEDTVTVSSGELRPFSFDATDCPDLFPALAVLAAKCRGESRIQGASRLVHKESNRKDVLLSELSALGVRISYEKTTDEIVVNGATIAGGKATSHNDHRIAMACAVAGLASEQGVTIEGEEAVAKSFPYFFS